MTIDLNSTTLYPTFDPGDMLQTIRDLPRQVRDAWQIAQAGALPADYAEIDRLVIGGMGGSAIGGDLLAGLMQRRGTVPVEVVRGYDLPAYLGGGRELFVASSKSGNTEETLSLLEQALEREMKVIAVTTGGKIGARVEELGLPVWTFSYEATPRASIGYSVALLLGLVSRLGVLPEVELALDEAVTELEALQPTLLPEVATESNPAKTLAQRLEGKLPVFFGSGFLMAVARRWKTQLNENAKSWAVWDELPELNHNSVVGFGLPKAVVPHLAVVGLRSNHDHPRVRVRWEVTQDLLTRNNLLAFEIYGQGDSPLAQLLTLIHFGDFVSYYVAALNGVDPTPVANIDYLKQQLAQIE